MTTHPDAILKIAYTKLKIDPVTEEIQSEEVYEFYPSGEVEHRSATFFSDVRSKQHQDITHVLPEGSFERLCDRLQECIRKVDRCTQGRRPSDSQVLIYHPFNRVEVMECGFGSSKETLEDILNEYMGSNVMRS